MLMLKERANSKLKPAHVWVLEFFWIISPKVSDLFEGISTSMTLTKFDDRQSSPRLGLRNFLDGLTEIQTFWREILCLDGHLAL